jgi:anaerobic selenocysteine-containing dehydrogenase
MMVHPRDAARLGLRDGAEAELESAAGRIRLPVEITDAVIPGVVSVPHGWGHDRPDTGQRIAATRPGASINDLTDPALLDEPSGTAVLNGVPVTVARAS